MALTFGRRLTVVQLKRMFSSTCVNNDKHYPLVVLGGGTGGCSVAARMCKVMGPGKVAVVEPCKYHYYQPMWTLVGAGIKKVEDSTMLMKDVLPKTCEHHNARVAEFDPEKNTVTLDNGEKLSYDYLVVGLGIQLNFNKVDGLTEALKEDPMVCSNFWRESVEKTYPALQNFKGGNAIFTFPSTPIKCAGAPQKIMYLADEYWRKSGVRDKTHIMYNSAIGVIFGVKKYAESLNKVVQQKNITTNFKRELVGIDHTKKEAYFKLMDSETGEVETYHYDFIHATPPMSGPDVMKNSTSPIVDAGGWLDVNKNTMQHNKFPNIFGLGDCTSIPTSRTAAAVAGQNKILVDGLKAVLAGKQPNGQYDGYTSCPLITGYHSCILAEFDFDGQPLETFPINQAKPRRTMFHMKKDIMPIIYWRMLLSGHWAGPKIYRKMLHLWMSK